MTLTHGTEPIIHFIWGRRANSHFLYQKIEAREDLNRFLLEVVGSLKVQIAHALLFKHNLFNQAFP